MTCPGPRDVPETVRVTQGQAFRGLAWCDVAPAILPLLRPGRGPRETAGEGPEPSWVAAKPQSGGGKPGPPEPLGFCLLLQQKRTNTDRDIGVTMLNFQKIYFLHEFQ